MFCCCCCCIRNFLKSVSSSVVSPSLSDKSSSSSPSASIISIAVTEAESSVGETSFAALCEGRGDKFASSDNRLEAPLARVMDAVGDLVLDAVAAATGKAPPEHDSIDAPAVAVDAITAVVRWVGFINRKDDHTDTAFLADDDDDWMAVLSLLVWDEKVVIVVAAAGAIGATMVGTGVVAKRGVWRVDKEQEEDREGKALVSLVLGTARPHLLGAAACA